MMELAAARARADEAKTAAAAATKAAIAADELHAEAERHVASLEGTLFPSRTVNDNGPTHAENEWSFLTHTREMTRVMRRRKVALGTRTVAPSPRDGKDGYLEHPRLGLLSQRRSRWRSTSAPPLGRASGWQSISRWRSTRSS